MYVSEEFCLQIKKPPTYGKEALLFSNLLQNIKRLCEKNVIEESIIAITGILKWKIILFISKFLFIQMRNTSLYIQIT